MSGYAAGSRIIKRPNAVVIMVAVEIGLRIQGEELATLPAFPRLAADTVPRKIVARRRRRDEGGPPVP